MGRERHANAVWDNMEGGMRRAIGRRRIEMAWDAILGGGLILGVLAR